MIRKIDYFHESFEDSIKYGIENFLTENLYFTTVEKFIKQMKLNIQNFDKFIADIRGNRIKLVKSILDIIDKEKLSKIVSKYSYRIATENWLYIELVPEKDEQTKLTNYYIHLSPISKLDCTGIKCKTSGKFENYEPRIYLYPLHLSKSIDASDFDLIYRLVYKKCEGISITFNQIYNENKTYKIYMVELPKNFTIYTDPSNEDEAVYIENNIPAKCVHYLGYI